MYIHFGYLLVTSRQITILLKCYFRIINNEKLYNILKETSVLTIHNLDFTI